jgi:hypothetical protein
MFNMPNRNEQYNKQLTNHSKILLRTLYRTNPWDDLSFIKLFNLSTTDDKSEEIFQKVYQNMYQHFLQNIEWVLLLYQSQFSFFIFITEQVSFFIILIFFLSPKVSFITLFIIIFYVFTIRSYYLIEFIYLQHSFSFIVITLLLFLHKEIVLFIQFFQAIVS